jgi:hypothetical protein
MRCELCGGSMMAQPSMGADLAWFAATLAGQEVDI